MAALPCGFRNISRRIFMPTRNCSWASLLRSRRETNDACVFIYSRYSSTGGSGSGAEKVDEQTSKKVQPKKFDLTFEEYQKLRRKLRTRQRIAGLPVGALALVTSSAVSAYLNPNMFDAAPEQIQPIMGLDPLIFCGICGVVSAGVGYVAGSACFGVLWKFFNSDLAAKMEKREVDFLERIVSHRASSFSKFEDDFYGESIKNLSDYRQWVRKQFEKKKLQEKYDQKKESDDKKDDQRTEES